MNCERCEKLGFDKCHCKRPGAPVGNRNAAKQHTRPKLNVRVEPATLEWLQRQAERDGVNIGRWLDALAYKYT
jgi:hypothetical protein